MYKAIFVTTLLACLSGCIKLQMPEDLVSDTVKAIKGDDDEETAQGDAGTTFTHSVVGAAGSPEADLKKTCLSELEARTTELLNAGELTFTVISENVSVAGDKAIANCTVSIE